MLERALRYLSAEENQIILLAVCALLAITFSAYLPALQNAFTNWDDPGYILNNEMIRDISPAGLGNIFTSFHQYLYKPLVILSFAIEYHFFGLAPFPYHLTNIIFHLFNCALVFWLLKKTSNNLHVALIAALLFGIHPLHVESVAWVTERKDVLSAFFFLSALIFYHAYRTHQKRSYYYLSLAVFILSLLAKPMGITLPAVLMLMDYYWERRLSRRLFTDKIIFFVIAVFFMWMNKAAYEFSPNKYIMPLEISWDSFFVANYGILFYLYKMILPLRLSCLYAYPIETGFSLPLIFLLSPFIVAILAVLVVASVRLTRKIAFGVVFFIITVFPVLQLFPTGPAMVADGYFISRPSDCFISLGILSWLHDKNYHSSESETCLSHPLYRPAWFLVGPYLSENDGVEE